MSKVYEGEEWKRVVTPSPRRTRAQEQRRIDTEYCNGRMELDEWKRRTDELSEVSKWTAEGRVLK